MLRQSFELQDRFSRSHPLPSHPSSIPTATTDVMPLPLDSSVGSLLSVHARDVFRFLFSHSLAFSILASTPRVASLRKP